LLLRANIIHTGSDVDTIRKIDIAIKNRASHGKSEYLYHRKLSPVVRQVLIENGYMIYYKFDFPIINWNKESYTTNEKHAKKSHDMMNEYIKAKTEDYYNKIINKIHEIINSDKDIKEFIYFIDVDEQKIVKDAAAKVRKNIPRVSITFVNEQYMIFRL
jgi:hypothetical protein